MKRVAKLTADDGDVRVDVSIRVNSRNGLAKWEVDRILSKASNGSAGMLRDLPYTAFGIENTKLR